MGNNTKKNNTTQTETNTAVPFTSADRLEVFSVKETGEGDNKRSIWTRAGAAFVNRDGSLNIILDVLPLDGKLQVRRVIRGESKSENN